MHLLQTADKLARKNQSIIPPLYQIAAGLEVIYSAVENLVPDEENFVQGN
jgi:hypothetical protein